MFYALVLLGGLAALHGVQAAGTADDKIARDLKQVIEAASTPKVSWAKDVIGLRMVKVLIVADSPDPDLVTLRVDVIARGGSVCMRYASVRALSAMLPAQTVGIDASVSLYQGSPSMANFESKVANDQRNKVDGHGHGSHVASVAAGRGGYQTPGTSGIAPGANLYDVKVLDGNGSGQMSDVIAGIDWVIYYARAYNIRVMNLSLAADSTETWQTDPLARAARSAVAAGITVVVAAGNFGQAASGAERFGSISSPGHDPSVITVGSANTRSTAERGDDSVDFFSSRGPTRGSHVDASGLRRVDNLLRPDLVAPGNRIVDALSSDKGAAC